MVFTEIQRRTLVAIFREIKRPSKEIQSTIAEQLGLKVSDGHDYQLEDGLMLGVTSVQAREALKAVSGSLGQAIVDERWQA